MASRTTVVAVLAIIIVILDSSLYQMRTLSLFDGPDIAFGHRRACPDDGLDRTTGDGPG